MGCFDLQVNGYAGVDFNSNDLTREELQLACRKLRDDGVDRILATVITDIPELMMARLGTIAGICASDASICNVIAGIHFEGPFINPHDQFRGAHPIDGIRAADPVLMDDLLTAAAGLTRLVTLAPEQDSSLKTITLLRENNVIVSAGHTNASLETLERAISAGLSMFTHLGNGCPPMLPRHDNIVQRALALRDKLWLCFIADGVHIPFFALRNYLDFVGFDRAIVATDAMAAAGLGPGRYTLARWEIEVGPDLAARSPNGSHLLGSAASLSLIKTYLTKILKLNPIQCAKLTEENPRKALGL